MKKSEMEFHANAYHATMAKAFLAEREGLYREAIQHALSTWDHIDGMMQFERKYKNQDFNSVSALEIILKYSPVLFDFQSLDKLDELLKTYGRIERNTAADMGQKLTEARAEMWEHHRLWTHLESIVDPRQDELRRHLGGDQNWWRTAIDLWETMGIVRRTPSRGSYVLSLSTRMDELVSAKCPACGTVAEAPKAFFLETSKCPSCRKSGFFVILAPPAVPAN